MFEAQENAGLWSKIKAFTKECVRVFKITKKPTKDEFLTISKIAGLGILIIGLIGFIVTLVKSLIFK